MNFVKKLDFNESSGNYQNKGENIMNDYQVDIKEYGYVNMLLKWFEGQELSLEILMSLLDYEIPQDIENYKLFLVLNNMGWWYDRIETFSKNEIKSDDKFIFYHKELKKFYV